MSGELPLDVRAYIFLRAQAGDKYQTIVENVAYEYNRIISTGTITKIKDKFEETKSLLDKPRSGRPILFDPMEEEKIVTAVEKDPKMTAVDVCNDTKLNQPHASLRTIQYLLNDHGLIATTTHPQSLKPDTIEKRLAFAEEYIKKPEIWSKIIFSDESDLFPYKSGKLFIRRRKGEYPLSYYNIANKWDKRTVKVWGCISAQGVGPLVRYEKSMNHIKLLNIYENKLLPKYPNLRGTSTRQGALLFQQDGAGPHRDNEVDRWFKDHKIVTIAWPPYSPDLNPLENIWGIIQDKLYEYNDKLKNSDDVWKKVLSIWKNDVNKYILDLYKSMPDRMFEVIDRNGGRLDR